MIIETCIQYFPLDPFIEWLGYRNDETLSRREFSFTLKDDVYTRFRSFTSKEELHQAFIKTKPEKVLFLTNRLCLFSCVTPIFSDRYWSCLQLQL